MLFRNLTYRALPIAYSLHKPHRSSSRLSTCCAAGMSTSTKPSIRPCQPIHWILDWDGTITRHDTLNDLVNISASTKPNSPTLDAWKRVTQAYIDDYTSTLGKIAPDGGLPKTVEEEKTLLKNLKAVEQRSLDRVTSSGIFSGLTAAHIDAGAQTAISTRQIELRPDFAQFSQRIQARTASHLKTVIHILSVNWSQHFISSCLRAFNIPIEVSTILSNEFEGVQKGRSSNGHIGPATDMMVISSDDKLRWLERLRQEDVASGNATPVVYVGDSWTDIECLLAADLGICIRDEPMGSSQRKLAEALERLGIRCPRMREWRETDEWKVVWARDFGEITEWVEGLDCSEL